MKTSKEFSEEHEYELEEHDEGGYLGINTNRFTKLLDEYASQFQQEWIPVEVRLPENNDGLINDTVLFTCGNVVRLGCYDYEDGFWHERYGGKYIDIRSHMKDEIKGGHITHWKHITLSQPYNPKQS